MLFQIWSPPLTPSFVADAIAPAANNRYSVPYESSYPSHRRYMLCCIEDIYAKYSVLFFVRKLLCKKLWGSLWGELWGKTGRKQAALQRPVFYTFFLCFELSKLVVYLLSLVVEVFIRVVGIASVHSGGLDVSVKGMPRPKHHCLQIAPCFFISRTKRNVKLVFV